ncbi:MAG TPA: CheR family methyltransferase [Gemmataceae bacterium]|jgi:chemotaxis protein methyltransferase WspC
MNVCAAAEQLREQIGLDPHSLGTNALKNIVAERMRALGITDPRRYAAFLADSADEMAALIDAVVVPETWFFRGGEVFSFLAEHIRRATETAASPAFRVLSAPCSSGEEPYSLVIALVEARVPRERWTMDGIDISSASLSRARCGLYRDLAFRETPAELRRKHFHQKDDSWELGPSLRSLVRFREGNLLDPDLLNGEGAYDLIFCRNVLIYMHEEARARVLANLDRLLSPRGLLCMGHAEPWTLFEQRFQTTGPHHFFLFGRTPATGVPPQAGNPLANGRRAPAGKPSQPAHTGRAPKRRIRPTAEPLVPSVPARPLDRLAQARQEADVGMLDKALQSCQEHLSIAKPSADAYSLLGVILQARKERKQAVECFRKALYLDPQHDEALLHLSLLYQESGDEAAAKLLRRRLERKGAGGET